MSKINLAIIFGSRSSEHEVSIVTTFQAWDWLDKNKYNRYLIYLDQQNTAYLCPPIKKSDYKNFINKVVNSRNTVEFIKEGIRVKRLFGQKMIKIDVALLTMHGTYGEDGKIQGMLDFYNIPYTSPGVTASAIGMDKVIQKNIFSKLGLKTAPYIWFYNYQYLKKSKEIVKKVRSQLKYPLFVKPANGGSSIGISKINNEKQLDIAIKKASNYDHKILIEQAIENSVDINCAVMGGYNPKVTLCEQPFSEDQFLSFKEKYLKGGKTKGMAGLSRIIPAPIPDKISQSIQEAAKQIFNELGCWGAVRVDFLYQESKSIAYPCEINTIPGSLAFYLWQASGLKPKQMIDEIISLAILRGRQNKKLNYQYKSSILNQK